MANEITIVCNLSVEKGYVSLNKAQDILVTFNGTAFTNHVQRIGVSPELIVIPAEIATGGYAWFRNIHDEEASAPNDIEIGASDGSTFYPVAKLQPGEIACFRVGTLTLYAKAASEESYLEVCILDD